MTYKQIRNIILILAGVGCVGYVVFVGYQLTVANEKDPYIIINAIPDDYIALFKNSKKGSFTVNETRTFKFRNSVSLFYYDNKYALEVTKIDSSLNLPVNNIISQTYESTNTMDNVIYISFTENGFKTNYVEFDKANPSKINITLYGDSVQSIIKNDSIAYYYLKLKNCAVSYGPNSDEMIFVDADQGYGRFSNIPLNLMFIKKHHTLYFVLLAPKDPSAKLDPYFLYNLVEINSKT